MSIRNTPTRWGHIAQFLHWLIVIMIIIQVILANIAEDLPIGPKKIEVYAWHKSVGITVLCLAILRLLWRAFGALPAFVISAVIFGAAHLFNPGATILAAICIALEAGVMLGAFYALTGRLWMSIGVHAAWNFTEGYVFGAPVSGMDFGPAMARSIVTPSTPTWATGGAFGPESSFPALVVCLTVGLVVLWYAYKAGRFTTTQVGEASVVNP